MGKNYSRSVFTYIRFQNYLLFDFKSFRQIFILKTISNKVIHFYNNKSINFDKTLHNKLNAAILGFKSPQIYFSTVLRLNSIPFVRLRKQTAVYIYYAY